MAEEETPQALGESQGANAPKDKKEWAKKSELHMVKGRNLTRDILTRLRENEIAEAANKMAAMENANREKEMKKIEVAKKATKHTEVIVTSFKCIQDIEEVILQTEDSCSKLRHEKYAGFAALQVCVRRLELRAERPAAETFDDRLHQALQQLIGDMRTTTFCLSLLVAASSAFSVVPTVRPAATASPALASRAVTAPTMVVEPSSVDATTLALALSLPIPAFSPAKAFVMMISNLIIIFGMTIQGKGLAAGVSKGMSLQEAHDDMVESFGLTWLLSGTAFGHIIGAGAILGCSAGGWF